MTGDITLKASVIAIAVTIGRQARFPVPIMSYAVPGGLRLATQQHGVGHSCGAISNSS